MIYRWLTDLTVTVHFAFLIFVVAGGLLARRYRWVAVPHLLCVAWGVYVEAMPGLICPLTPLENHFAMRAGREGYEGSFIEHYLVPIIYPEGLTRTVQLVLAGFVLGINLVVYGWTPVRRYFSQRAAAKTRAILSIVLLAGLCASLDVPRDLGRGVLRCEHLHACPSLLVKAHDHDSFAALPFRSHPA